MANRYGTLAAPRDVTCTAQDASAQSNVTEAFGVIDVTGITGVFAVTAVTSRRLDARQQTHPTNQV